MRRGLILTLMIVSACAHGPTVAPSAPVGHHRVAWAEVPAGLAQDPREFAVQPLSFEVVEPEIRKLKNGVPVYLLRDDSVPLVTIYAQISAGAVDEPADKLGLAEVTLALMTQGGAGDLGPDALDELLEFHAANLNYDAGPELSGVGINFLSADLDRLLPIYADVLLRPRFAQERFEVAIARRLETVRRRPDDPAGLAHRTLKKAVHGPDTLYGRESSAESLQRLRLDDVRAFHRRMTVPANLRLLATGDFDPDMLVEKLDAVFGGLEPGERITRTWAAAPPRQRRVIYVPRPELAQAKIRIGTRGFERHDEIEHAASVMSDALGGGLGAGRLYREIRERQGLAYSAYSWLQAGPTGGLFCAGADTRPDAVGRTIQSMLALMEDTRANGFGDDELGDATQRSLNRFVFRFDSPWKILYERSAKDALGYPGDYLETYRERISAVGPDRARLAAERLLDPASFQIVVVGPEGLEQELSRFGPVTIIDDVDRFEPRR